MTVTWEGDGSEELNKNNTYKISCGKGADKYNCDDPKTSNTNNTNCTPKGTFTVDGKDRRLSNAPGAEWVTYFVKERGIAFHYYPSVPDSHASHGCVRVKDYQVAKMIHDHSVIGKTVVNVSGNWIGKGKKIVQ